MAKKQRKEPWNSKVHETQELRETHSDDRMERSSREKAKIKKKKSGTGSTVFLTFLVAIMFAIIGAAIIFTIWNNRNPNMTSIESQFYNSGSPKSSSSSGTAASSSTAASSTSASSSAAAGNTYTVVAGDYPSLIAQKTGVSWDNIVKLNPTLDGNNPGYYKDGSQLSAGQTLIISK